MKEATSWVAVVVFGFGLYCLWAAFQLKVKGEINNSLLLGKEYVYKTCKDKEGYIKEMFPHLLTFGIITTACGTIDLINTFVKNVAILYYISLVLFVLDFIWFTKISINMKKKYY